MSASGPVDKSHMANHLFRQNEDVFHTTFMSAIGQPTSKFYTKFNSIKVPLSNIYLDDFMHNHFAIQQNHDHC